MSDDKDLQSIFNKVLFLANVYKKAIYIIYVYVCMYIKRAIYNRDSNNKR